jgi:hypothetical protein
MGLLYDATGNWGDSLFDSLSDYQKGDVFNAMAQDEYDYELKESYVGGDRRYDFVEWLMEKLTLEQINEIAKLSGLLFDDETITMFNEYQNIPVEKRVYDWLIQSECPEDIESEGNPDNENWMCWDWVGVTVQELWSDLDKGDDYEVALFMGYLRYPGFDQKNKRYVETEGCIPVETLSKIHETDRKIFACRKFKSRTNKRKVKLEKRLEDLKNSLIVISGANGPNTEWEFDPVPMDKAPQCPECGGIVPPGAYEEEYLSLVTEAKRGAKNKKEFAIEVCMMDDEHWDRVRDCRAPIECPSCGDSTLAMAKIYLKSQGYRMPTRVEIEGAVELREVANMLAA